jgi:hypothetical protein
VEPSPGKLLEKELVINFTNHLGVFVGADYDRGRQGTHHCPKKLGRSGEEFSFGQFFQKYFLKISVIFVVLD